MAEDGTQDDAQTGADNTTTTEPQAGKEGGDERVPYERFKKANDKAKEASDKADRLEKELVSVRAQMEERENAGLPELERERKAREQLEKRVQEAEAKAEQADLARIRSQRERLVLAAASRANFDDPSDALRFAEFVDLDEIEDSDQAERAVKKLAKAKPRLLKDDEPGGPPIGRVLEPGKSGNGRQQQRSDIDLSEEAQMLAGALKKFARN